MEEFKDLHKFTDQNIQIQLKNRKTINGHCFCVDPITKSLVVISKKNREEEEEQQQQHQQQKQQQEQEQQLS